VLGGTQQTGEVKMTVITTLYYLKYYSYVDDDWLLGRALTNDEYENITADGLRAAIIHSTIDNRDGWDLRSSPEAAR
jgi:hypothetical protein